MGTYPPFYKLPRATTSEKRPRTRFPRQILSRPSRDSGGRSAVLLLHFLQLAADRQFAGGAHAINEELPEKVIDFVLEAKAVGTPKHPGSPKAKPGGRSRPGAHYFYGHYYAVQCMYLAGGEHWVEWWPAIREELIASQSESGLWTDNHAGSSYGSAMALIILQMPKRYLPIFQK